MQKIAIIEDEKTISDIIKYNLEKEGYQVHTAYDGEEGLALIDEVNPDLIMLDPPRDGVHPKALEKIISFGVNKMVYIACKPTSLARDLEMLQGRGYKVERIACVDLFPNTYHVETLALLTKA